MMMRQIAIYGKGGIGKSTIAANLSASLAEMGYQVLQVGCDPKHDSTRMLLGGEFRITMLEAMRLYGRENLSLELVVHEGYQGIRCVEAGGPEPGVGCAGQGIITTFKLLEELKVYESGIQVVLYDVLGDVVCGGFAVPIREGYAREIYLVTSGELMSLYAANNICRGIVKFAQRGEGRLAGVIGNSKGLEYEYELVEKFAERIGSRLIQFFPWDRTVPLAEIQRKTVIEYAPYSSQALRYRDLAQRILEAPGGVVPRPLEIEELEALYLEFQ